MHRTMNQKEGKFYARNQIFFNNLPKAPPDLPVDWVVGNNSYTFLPPRKYRIIVAIGPYDGTKQSEFLTDKNGKIVQNFLGNILGNGFADGWNINPPESAEKITILVEKGNDKRIISEFTNYAELKKTMNENDGKFFNSNYIDFEALTVALPDLPDLEDDLELNKPNANSNNEVYYMLNFF
ncbi:hypothetical protein niasHS_001158 [Heterodera schachtii]|uniref:Uncharacterized protein n=1 Tax=Heterodera schachtii TaxID=97005 RepID=A0ABD2KCE8_HETSC